ncbi:MAG: anthranilate phosphoribosyltransferase [Gemmatimonadota bacterium]|nr:anthranilate phosphoribosyltransferase [Gemmatimonadota bacterium]
MDVRSGVDPSPEERAARLRAAGDPHACLRAITAGRDLTATESRALFETIMEGQTTPVVIGAILAALRTKGETVDEIAGAAAVMRAKAERVETSRSPLVDTCGTGGDFSGTFNISTTAAFVAAAAGAPVAKHGNRAASSRSGSADVLEALGVAIDLDPRQVGECVDEVGIGFLFAPRFHPAMRHAIGARREIAIRTLYNLLGPLTNPAGATRQVIGVPTADTVEPIAAVLERLGSEHALVVHGREGLDEISVAGPTIVATVADGTISLAEVGPEDLGLDAHPPEAVLGGDAAENARITRAILEGRGSEAQSAIVAANAGAAILVGGRAASLKEGVAVAREVLEGGEAARVLDRLIDVSERFSRET